MTQLSVHDRLNADQMKFVLSRIRGHFNETPEENLFYTVIDIAIRDAFGRVTSHETRHDAIKFLLLPKILYAEAVGISSDWIRSLIKEGLKRRKERPEGSPKRRVRVYRRSKQRG
jgi:hypothetical protein